MLSPSAIHRETESARSGICDVTSDLLPVDHRRVLEDKKDGLL